MFTNKFSKKTKFIFSLFLILHHFTATSQTDNISKDSVSTEVDVSNIIDPVKKELMENQVNVHIDNMELPLNSDHDDYHPTFTADENHILFSTKRNSTEGGHDETGDNYEDIFESFKTEDGWSEPIEFDKSINSHNHESNPSITPDGNHIYFYKFLTTKEKKKKKKDITPNIGNGDIFYSEKIEDEWLTPQALPTTINSESWESHPSITSDETMLFFISDREGGSGGWDIYMARKSGNTWEEAENLGSVINTSKNEASPHFDVATQTLYFSSQGIPGMGGFDIFKSKLVDGAWQEPVNIGYPVNQEGNDLFFVLSLNNPLIGYFSSDRATTKGGLDLFEVEFIKQEALKMLYGDLSNIETEDPIIGDVFLIDTETGDTIKTRTDEFGKYELLVPRDGKYQIIIVADADFKEYIEEFSILASSGDSIQKNVGLDKSYLLDYNFDELKTVKTEMPPYMESFDISMRHHELVPIAEKQHEGLFFKVQIAAFRNRISTSHSYFSNVSDPIATKTLADGITRYTIGKYNTLSEADAKLKSILSLYDDAFITAIYNGERIYIRKVIELLSDKAEDAYNDSEEELIDDNEVQTDEIDEDIIDDEEDEDFFEEEDDFLDEDIDDLDEDFLDDEH